MKTTHLVITIFFITIGIYDLVVVLWTGVTSSVSQVLVDAAYITDIPVFLIALGFTLGHLFGRMKPSKKKVKP